MNRLPVDELIPDILKALQANKAIVLQASPGTGKTTRVPPALLRSSFLKPSQQVWVLEPRRLAAKFAAHRVAQEMGETVGMTVGYQFRFENVGGPSTRLKFLTEGMLMRRLVSDPNLSTVGAVVLDEFHERNLHGDVALAHLRKLQNSTRLDLRIVVMSATLDAEPVSTFLQGAPVFKVEAPLYPIDLHYLPGPPSKPLEELVKQTVLSSLDQSRSSATEDILVFLPGMAEIRRCEQALARLPNARNLIVLPLHGDLSREEQDLALKPADRRKIILATNVAETSLTIEGVNTVIDSGLHRQASYSWWSGVPSLQTKSISKASAIQRMGRAGRTGPGRCYRLFHQSDFEGRPQFEKPEIQRADIAQTYLELKTLGVENPSVFGWYEAPSQSSIDAAAQLLFRLGAMEGPNHGSALTSLGQEMARLPAPPRIARLLLEGKSRGVLGPVAVLAALLTEGRLEQLDALEHVPNARRDPALKRAIQHFLSSVGTGEPPWPEAFSEPVARCVLVAFPDRVGGKRKASASRVTTGWAEIVLSAGGSAEVLDTGPIAQYEYFVALDLSQTQGKDQARARTRLRSVVPISSEWLLDLSPVGITDRELMEWDREKQRVVTLSQLVYDSLVLEESRGNPSEHNSLAASRVLLKEGLGLDWEKAKTMGRDEWLRALRPFADSDALESAFARWALYRRYRGEPVEDTKLSELVLHNIEGKTSLREIHAVNWSGFLFESLESAEAHALARDLPLEVILPGGRRVKVNYRADQPPWIESRLQDFFGMKRGPQVMGGKLPLAIHLLAPNGRALQVTTDLTNFWQKTYPELRNALSRRYPRHSWPEDPANAVPPAPRFKSKS